jgi:hypothetical protein
VGAAAADEADDKEEEEEEEVRSVEEGADALTGLARFSSTGTPSNATAAGKGIATDDEAAVGGRRLT